MDKYSEFISPYDRDCANLFVRVEHLARYLYAAEFIRKRRLKHVLDCACGDGYGSRVMAAQAEAVTGVDINEELINLGRAEDAAAGIQNIRYVTANLNDSLGIFEDNSFDCITCFETLEHIEQEEMLLTEFARVLRRGRWLLLSVPKAGYEPTGEDGTPENPWHLRLYTVESLQKLLGKCGFIVEQALSQPYTNMSRANMESFRRNKCISSEVISSYFNETPESLEFFARIWGWPVDESQDKSNVIFMVCRRA